MDNGEGGEAAKHTAILTFCCIYTEAIVSVSGLQLHIQSSVIIFSLIRIAAVQL